MNFETYKAKMKKAFDKTEQEKQAKIEENNKRIEELEAKLRAEEARIAGLQKLAELGRQRKQLEEDARIQQEVEKYTNNRGSDMTPPPFMQKERKQMGVTIKEVDDEAPAPMPAGIEKSIDTAKLLAEFNQTVQLSTAKAVEQSMGYADKLSRELMDTVKTQLTGISKPRVMVVEIDTKKFKLTKPATKLLPRLITMVKADMSPMLVGPAGSGKSVAVEQLAEALGSEYAQVCCTGGMSETWLFGRQTPNGFVEAPFSKMFGKGGTFNMEEIDAAGENVLMSINTAMASGFLYNPISGELIKRHPEFYLCATANTFGKGGDGVYTARNRLDGSTLTRWRPIMVDYDEDIEARVCPDDELRAMFQNARKKLREMKSQEIISTRCLMFAYREKSLGIPLVDILATQTCSWPDGLAEQVGMVAPKEGRAKDSKGRFMPKGEAKQAEGVF